MNIILNILIIAMIICVGFILYCLYMLYRNDKVYNVRIYILDNYPHLYDYLPEYDEMLYSIKPLTKKYWLNYCIKKNLN